MDAYTEYLELQTKLIQLIDAGKEDSIETDELRDQMDDVWERLTLKQQRKLNKDLRFPDLRRIPGEEK